MVKHLSAYNVGDPGSISGLGRSPGEGNGKPLQYSCLGNPMDREAWKATVLGAAKRVGHDLVTKNRNHHIKAYKVRNGVSSFHSTHPPQWKSILKVRFIYV